MTTHTFARRFAALAAIAASAVAVAGAPAMASTEPKIAVSIDDAGRVGEGGVAEFTVFLSQKADHDVQVAFETVDRTATAGGDYKPVSNKLIIKAGHVRGEISVGVIDDQVGERAEAFGVQLTAARGAVIGDEVGFAVIVDDDCDPIACQ